MRIANVLMCLVFAGLAVAQGFIAAGAGKTLPWITFGLYCATSAVWLVAAALRE